MKNTKLYLLGLFVLLLGACSDDDPEVTCPLDPLEATVDVVSDFTDASQDYYFEDYQATFTGLTATVEDDCKKLKVTGDFLDWGTIDDTFTPMITLTVTPNSGDDTKGSLSFTEEIMGLMSDGFTYRMSTTGTNGTYDATAGTATFSVYVDYDVSGDWVYWFTTTVTLTVQ